MIALPKLSMEDIIEIERTMNSKTKKPKDMNAPKRPQSAFFLWANSRRPAVMQENPDMRLGKIGKLLGEEWKTVDAATKAQFQENYIKSKAVYDKQLAKYQKTDDYHNHRVASYAWRIHETKKPFRKDENAPKRPMSGYMLYTNAVREGVVKSHENMTYTQVLKEIGNMWKVLSAEDRAPWEKQAQKDRKEYQGVLGYYHETAEYKKYIAERAAYKEKMVATRHKLMKIKKKKKRTPGKKSRSVSRARSKGRRAVRRRRRVARKARTPKSPKRSSSRARKARKARKARRAKRRSSSRSASRKSTRRSSRRSSSRKARRGGRKASKRRSGSRRRPSAGKKRRSSRSKSARRGARRARKAKRRARKAKAKKPASDAGSSATGTSAAEDSSAVGKDIAE